MNRPMWLREDDATAATGVGDEGGYVPLHPQVKTLIDSMSAAGGPPIDSLAPDQARELMRGLAAMETKVEIHRVDDRTIPGPGCDIPIRVYTPAEAVGADRGVLLWFHGGGFVVGDLETADPTCRLLAEGSGCVVVSVDYRLAPEHRAPAALEDCVASVMWTAENAELLGVDATRIAVGGDSAGGNLAALVCHRVRDDFGPRIDFQLLVYPVTDLTAGLPSYEENAEGYFLTRATMKWFIAHHIGDEVDPTDPMVSPLHATSFVGLPAAMVLTAEFDPLRDEGEAYARLLADAGVQVDARRYDGQIHGFFGMATLLEDGKTAVDLAADAIRSVLT